MKICSLLICLVIVISDGGVCSPELVGASEIPTSLRSLGNGFWNAHVPFQVNQLEIGTQMSLIQLQNGNFLVVDTVVINNQLKNEIDVLTQNGTKIEAVLAVHPFHTLAYSDFNKMYPGLKYYGTPRHLRKLTDIKWEGQLDNGDNEALLSKWAPEVELRIPDGAEYYDPQPESSNHFVCVFVYHRGSKSVHVDDTLIYAEDPTWAVRTFFKVAKGSLIFHPKMTSDGLYPTPEAPLQFRDWMKQMLEDWDFDNLCTAHIGVKVGGAHDAVEQLVNNSEKLFEDLSERNKNNSKP